MREFDVVKRMSTAMQNIDRVCFNRAIEASALQRMDHHPSSRPGLKGLEALPLTGPRSCTNILPCIRMLTKPRICDNPHLPFLWESKTTVRAKDLVDS